MRRMKAAILCTPAGAGAPPPGGAQYYFFVQPTVDPSGNESTAWTMVWSPGAGLTPAMFTGNITIHPSPATMPLLQVVATPNPTYEKASIKWDIEVTYAWAQALFLAWSPVLLETSGGYRKYRLGDRMIVGVVWDDGVSIGTFSVQTSEDDSQLWVKEDSDHGRLYQRGVLTYETFGTATAIKNAFFDAYPGNFGLLKMGIWYG